MKKIVVASPDPIAQVGMNIFQELSKYIFECVTDLDLAALYPSIIRALNISVETCIGKVYYEGHGSNGEDLVQDYMSGDILSFGNKYMSLPTVDDMIDIINSKINSGEIILEEEAC